MKPKVKKATRFWHLRQNNSGGSFSFNKKAGITHNVIIEAHDVTEARQRAEEIGCYWDGVSKGFDCDCCGDRWSPPYGEGDKTPSLYGEALKDIGAQEKAKEKNPTTFKWMKKGFETCVHYLNGKKEWYG